VLPFVAMLKGRLISPPFAIANHSALEQKPEPKRKCALKEGKRNSSSSLSLQLALKYWAASKRSLAADALSACMGILCADVMVLQQRGLRSCFAADAGRSVGRPAGTQ
jgi:hypothetical protein